MYSFWCFSGGTESIFFGSCITLSRHLNTKRFSFLHDVLFDLGEMCWWKTLQHGVNWSSLLPCTLQNDIGCILIFYWLLRGAENLPTPGFTPVSEAEKLYLSELRGLEAAVPLFDSTMELVTPSHKLVYKPTEVVPDIWHTHTYIYIL